MKIKICIVVSDYYGDIGSNLLKGAKLILDKHKKFENSKWKFHKSNPALLGFGRSFDDSTGKSAINLHEFEYEQRVVPGVFEIPVVIATNIEVFNAFIALGCVIKGETPHFDLITKATINGIMDLSIKHKRPIMNGIITCLNKKQARERADPSKKNKGGEAARALLHLFGITKKK